MSLKKPQIIPFLLAMVLLLGCGHHRYDGELALVDSLQKLDSVYLSDYLLQPIVSYYDRYGTRNQQAHAHYLLGRTYHIEGLLPQALDAYQTAAERADTTARDRDYSLLMKVYSQMHEVFKRQLLYQNEIDAISQMEKYAWLARDSFMAISSSYYKISPFYAIGQLDSVLFYGEKAIKELEKSDSSHYADFIYGSLIPVYLKQNDHQNMRRAMQLYESSDAFDSLGNVLPGGETFYFNKGMLYIDVGVLDSAEYYFRKELREGKDYNNQIAGTHGLSLVYERLNQPDSAYKYAKQVYILNDSAYNFSVTANLQQMQAAYDYSRHKERAIELEKSNQYLLFTIVVIIFGVMLLIILIGLVRQRSRVRQLKLERQIDRLCQQGKQQTVALRQKKEEIEKLQKRLVLEHDNQLLLKEMEENLKSMEMMRALQVLTDNRRQKSEQAIQESEIYSTIQRRLEERGGLSDGEWKRLESTVKKNLPYFIEGLQSLGKLSEQELRVSILLKLDFSPKEIATLTYHSPSAITLTRTRLYEKLLKTSSEFSSWDEFVKFI